MKVFISYSHEDNNLVEKLRQELKNQKIEYWIDTNDLKGGVWLQEIDNAIYNVDCVLGVITENYFESFGMTEAYVAMTEGFQKRNIKFIPLFYISPNKINSPFVKSQQGANFSKSFKNGMYDLLKILNELESKKDNPLTIIRSIESISSTNPFRHWKAELFRENYELLAKYFVEPQIDKYDLVIEKSPLYIFGGRGSGKTMILKSLTPEVIANRIRVNKFIDLKTHGKDFFGIFLKLTRGSLLNDDNNSTIEIGFLQTKVNRTYEIYKEIYNKLNNLKMNYLNYDEPMRTLTYDDPIIYSGLSAVKIIALNEINLKLLQATISQLKKYSVTQFLNIPKYEEELLVNKITRLLNIKDNTIRDFEDIEFFCKTELKKINDYCQGLSLPNSVLTVNWCHTDSAFLDDIFSLMESNISDLKGTIFYLLLDEFENLAPFQQEIINQWAKMPKKFVVKVACKYDGMYTTNTLENQKLQFNQDCYEWMQDYDVFDKHKFVLYKEFLVKICKKILELENYVETDIRNILDDFLLTEIPQVTIDEEIKKLRKKRKLKYDESKISTYRNQLQNAIIFRLLKKRSVSNKLYSYKIYAGLDILAYLSSGIVRSFLNLLGTALYKAERNGKNISKGDTISIEEQTWASKIVSEYWLEVIPTNELKYGETIYQFIVDIGHVFRERLLYNFNEPETLIFKIEDPINLNKIENIKLHSILTYSLRESILYEKRETSEQRPYGSKLGRTREFVLNRIYAPALELSHRARGGCRVICSTVDLTSLLDEKNRIKIKKRLKRKQHINEKIDEKTLDLYWGDYEP